MTSVPSAVPRPVTSIALPLWRASIRRMVRVLEGPLLILRPCVARVLNDPRAVGGGRTFHVQAQVAAHISDRDEACGAGGLNAKALSGAGAAARPSALAT